MTDSFHSKISSIKDFKSSIEYGQLESRITERKESLYAKYSVEYAEAYKTYEKKVQEEHGVTVEVVEQLINQYYAIAQMGNYFGIWSRKVRVPPLPLMTGGSTDYKHNKSIYNFLKKKKA